jgi:4-nitrophenyl phosphatase
MSDAELLPAVLCDLDGVVWLAGCPIHGSVEAIADLRRAGHRVLFVTNNSFARVAEQESALAAIGIAAVGDVVTSAMAAARLVAPGERAAVCGGPGIVEALERCGVEVVDDGPVGAVLVGFTRAFDYEMLRRAADLVRGGARLIGTNDDATYPTPEGLTPGGGSILAAVQVASGVEPVVAGKPHAPMADLVGEVLGGADASRRAVMVGDRPATDGRFARQLGCRYAHVWSGVTRPGGSDAPGAPGVVAADLVAADLAGVAAMLLDGGVGSAATDQ